MHYGQVDVFIGAATFNLVVGGTHVTIPRLGISGA
jgi:hypothetical protein